MNKEEIIEQLLASHTNFIEYLDGLTEEDFCSAPEGKWTAGQQLEHIIKSVKPLNKALLLPAFAIKTTFGVANRPSRSFDELVEKYNNKLQLGGIAPSKFAPEIITFEKKEALFNSLKKEVQKLIKKAEKLNDENMKLLVLPHPLLGKLTLREMFYFTIYHVGHHQKNIERSLQ